MDRPLLATSHPMHLTVDPYAGRCEIVAFGQVADGLPAARRRQLTERLAAVPVPAGPGSLGET